MWWQKHHINGLFQQLTKALNSYELFYGVFYQKSDMPQIQGSNLQYFIT